MLSQLRQELTSYSLPKTRKSQILRWPPERAGDQECLSYVEHGGLLFANQLAGKLGVSACSRIELNNHL